jgi:hypothetical protein
MKRFCSVVLLPLLTTWSLGQPVSLGQPSDPPGGPEVVVRSLYRDVIARHPVGIPYGANMKAFAPYLSERLRHRMDVAVTCGKDWYRQNAGRTLKPPFAWLEAGLFSGQDERTDPDNFTLERADSEKEGTIRVYVKLQGGTSTNKPWTWRVAVVLVKENGHFAVDDVIYLKDQYYEADSRLTEALAAGCDGPHWVGFSDSRRSP